MKIFSWVILGLLWFGSSDPLANALIIESPVEGQTIVVGEPFKWIVRPAPGEVCKSIAGEDFLQFVTGRYEYTDVIEPTESLGKKNILVPGRAVDANASCRNASVTVNIILPPTTKVVSIGADFDGRNKTFLEIARKPTGELIVTEGTRSTDTLSVSAYYSDGVARDMKNNPNVTYKSLNEKVAIVIPVGQKGNKYDELALVKATGPGKTDIIVQYGEFTDRVTVNVKECPYIEGETDKNGCPLR